MSNIFGGTKDFSPQVRKWFRSHNEDMIQKIQVQRAPVNAMITKALNWVTLGSFATESQKLGYDSFYHLSLIVTTNNGIWKIEKLSQIAISPWRDTGAEKMDVPMSKEIMIGAFFSRTRHRMGDADFFEYDAFKNNCQNFVLNMLMANVSVPPAVRQFIVQPVDELLKKLPGYTERVARTITDIGSIAERVIYGAGIAKSVIKKLRQE